jgi:hypothetical protein
VLPAFRRIPMYGRRVAGADSAEPTTSRNRVGLSDKQPSGCIGFVIGHRVNHCVAGGLRLKDGYSPGVVTQRAGGCGCAVYLWFLPDAAISVAGARNRWITSMSRK